MVLNMMPHVISNMMPEVLSNIIPYLASYVVDTPMETVYINIQGTFLHNMTGSSWEIITPGNHYVKSAHQCLHPRISRRMFSHGESFQPEQVLSGMR